jgi:hypothetical protein
MSRRDLLDFTLKALAAVIVAAMLVMIGTAVYGGLYDAIHRGAAPGGVPAHLGRSGGIFFHIRPWVRTLYDWSMALVLGSAVLLVGVAQLAKRLARKD